MTFLHRLYQLLLKAGSKITYKIAAIEGLQNLVRGQWEMVDTPEGTFRQRTFTYRQVPVPVSYAIHYLKENNSIIVLT